MGRICVVEACGSEYYPGCGLSFHRFPKDPNVREIWINIIPMSSNRKLTDASVVCSKHFKAQDFVACLSRPVLKCDAVPSVFVLDVANCETGNEDDSNKLDESGNKLGYCRCCLAQGSHQPFENEHSVTLMQLNLFLVETSALSDWICSQCVSLLDMVVEFRKKVMAAQQKLVEHHETQAEDPVVTSSDNPLPTTVLYIKEEELDLGVDNVEINPEIEDMTDPIMTEKRQEETSDKNVCDKSRDELWPYQNMTAQTTKGKTSKDQKLLNENCGQKNIVDIEDVLQPYVITDKPSTQPKPTDPKPVKLTKIVLQKKNLIPLKKTTGGRVPILSNDRVILSRGNQNILKPRGKPIQNVVAVTSSGQKDKVTAGAQKERGVKLASANKTMMPASANKEILPASVTKTTMLVSVNKTTRPVSATKTVVPVSVNKKIVPAKEKRKCEKPTSIPVLTVEPLAGYDEETDSADEIEELSAEDTERPTEAKRRRIDVTYIRIGEKNEIATDVTKIRSNITKLLHYSTATPFRTKCNMFQCFYCDNVYTIFKELKQHTEEEHEKDERKIFDSLQDIIIHADITDLRCGICRKTIKHIGLLVKHLQEHDKLLILYELNSESRQPSYGVIGYKLYHGGLACHMCGKTFKSVDTLKYHMAEHYNVNTCLVCDKNFGAKSIFVFHLKVHQKEKCADCLDPKRLSEGGLCAEHVRIANKLKECIRHFDSVKKYLHLYNKTHV